MSDQVAQRLHEIQARIRAACHRGGRSPDAVRLLAVSKTRPAAMVQTALEAGQLFFGENRVMEARDKIPLVPDATVQWHLIGPLQRNKVKVAVRLFHMVHSVDSLPLAQALSEAARSEALAFSRVMPVLIQVNLGREPQKKGVMPEEADALARAVATLPGVALRGLMAIPPRCDHAEAVRPYFRALSHLAQEIDQQGIPGVAMTELSMGMSHDFDVAVEEGATWVRVGSALFGARQP